MSTFGTNIYPPAWQVAFLDFLGKQKIYPSGEGRVFISDPACLAGNSFKVRRNATLLNFNFPNRLYQTLWLELPAVVSYLLSMSSVLRVEVVEEKDFIHC